MQRLESITTYHRETVVLNRIKITGLCLWALIIAVFLGFGLNPTSNVVFPVVSLVHLIILLIDVVTRAVLYLRYISASVTIQLFLRVFILSHVSILTLNASLFINACTKKTSICVVDSNIFLQILNSIQITLALFGVFSLCIFLVSTIVNGNQEEGWQNLDVLLDQVETPTQAENETTALNEIGQFVL